jgi:hypothetical protein
VGVNGQGLKADIAATSPLPVKAPQVKPWLKSMAATAIAGKTESVQASTACWYLPNRRAIASTRRQTHAGPTTTNRWTGFWLGIDGVARCACHRLERATMPTAPGRQQVQRDNRRSFMKWTVNAPNAPCKHQISVAAGHHGERRGGC